MNWFKDLFTTNKRIYLDYAAATPLLPEVLREMEKYFSNEFFNPNAIYQEGSRMKARVAEYKKQIAKIFGAPEEGIIFTSGGTEANVLAVRGVKPGKITIEEGSHPSIEAAVKSNNSKELTLVSSTAIDNKLGRKIREERKRRDSQYPLLHIDASQTAPYFNVSLEALACDLITLDSAKIYGPKGIGALVVRRGVNIELPPQGTPAVSLIAGFAKALQIAVRDRESERARLETLSVLFAETVKKSLPEAQITIILPNIVNVSVPGILPEYLVLSLDRRGILASAGPACESQAPEAPDTPLRFSFGRFTTKKEVEKAAEIFCKIARSMLKY